MLTWDNVGLVIRSVRGQRESQRGRLLKQVSEFASRCVVAYHGEGRTVPESYADALATYDGSSLPWVLQMEDDAYLSPDFGREAIRLLNDAAAVARVGLVSFYSGRRLRNGDMLSQPPILEYLSGRQFLMAQAIALPAMLIGSHNQFMLAWTAEMSRPYATDMATAAWLASRRFRFGRSWPSLVQHDNVPSLYGHHAHPNRSSPSFRVAYGEMPA